MLSSVIPVRSGLFPVFRADCARCADFDLLYRHRVALHDRDAGAVDEPGIREGCRRQSVARHRVYLLLTLIIASAIYALTFGLLGLIPAPRIRAARRPD